ncbi:hypothetical protein HDU83_002534 [Entophlyctis luteolus]|nr:hypothetical protein HDU83_002534 [Entophlyctis luteolus]
MNILVVGGTGGLGAATVAALRGSAVGGASSSSSSSSSASVLPPHSHVFVAGRRVDAAAAALFNANGKTAQMSTEVSFHKLDVTSMQECARLCDNIAADKRVAERGLHGLVLTAGNFNFALSRRVTDEGLEQTFALNYLSKFLIINRLLPSLMKASGSVVSVLAGGNGGFFDRNDIQMSKNYNCVKQAIQTGVLVDLMTIHLASLYPESTEAPKFYHLFPGLMNTDNVRNANIPAFAAAPLKMFILPLVGRNPSAVAEEDVIPLLLGRSGEGGASGRRYYPSGGLFHPGLKGVPAYKELVDAETRTRVWEESHALAKAALRE